MYAFRLCVVNDLRRGLQSVESFQTRLAALPHDRGYPLLLAGQQDRLPRDGHRPNFTSELHSGRKAMLNSKKPKLQKFRLFDFNNLLFRDFICLEFSLLIEVPNFDFLSIINFFAQNFL